MNNNSNSPDILEFLLKTHLNISVVLSVVLTVLFFTTDISFTQLLSIAVGYYLSPLVLFLGGVVVTTMVYFIFLCVKEFFKGLHTYPEEAAYFMKSLKDSTFGKQSTS